MSADERRQPSLPIPPHASDELAYLCGSLLPVQGDRRRVRYGTTYPPKALNENLLPTIKRDAYRFPCKGGPMLFGRHPVDRSPRNRRDLRVGPRGERKVGDLPESDMDQKRAPGNPPRHLIGDDGHGSASTSAVIGPVSISRTADGCQR